MKLAPLFAPLRVLVVTAALGLAFLTLAVLSFHYFSSARTVAAENGQLKDQMRGLIERMVDIEASMGAVAAARRDLDHLTLTEFESVVGRTGLRPETDGSIHRAMTASTTETATSGRSGGSSLYAALLDRLATARQSASSLAFQLKGTADALSRRQEVLRSLPSILPAKGWISSEFGMRESPFHRGVDRMHQGLDVAAPLGSAVFATADGVVEYAGNFGAYGKLVRISHGFGLATKYAHNEEIVVKRGDKVTRGQTIAKVGSTGRSTGAHVHYEILIHEKPVDPRRFLFDAKPEETSPVGPPATLAMMAMGGDSENLAERYVQFETPTNEQILLAAQSEESDAVLDAPALGTEWDAPIFTAEKGVLFSLAPGFLRATTAGDMVVICALFLLLAIASVAMRWPVAVFDEEAPVQEDRVLTPEQRVRLFNRAQREKMSLSDRVREVVKNRRSTDVERVG